MLAYADSQRWVSACGVNVLLGEREGFPDALAEVRVKVVKSKGHTAVRLRRVFLLGLDCKGVSVGNHVFYQFDSGVAFAFVVAFAPFGCHHNVLQTIDIRLHLHLYVFFLLSGLEGVHFGLVAYHLEMKSGVTICVEDTEIAVHIRRSTDGGGNRPFAGSADEVYLHKGERFAGLRIHHHAAYACPFLLCAELRRQEQGERAEEDAES